MNFTEAGRLLNVTQPAVSKSIAALEAYTGTKLFTREGSKLALTGEGESLYRTVQLSFLALENAIDQVSRVPKQKNALTLSLSTSFETGNFSWSNTGYSADRGGIMFPSHTDRTGELPSIDRDVASQLELEAVNLCRSASQRRRSVG
ncbi:LysR family transcriptional regulator [Mesorhizobium sp. M0296]